MLLLLCSVCVFSIRVRVCMRTLGLCSHTYAYFVHERRPGQYNLDKKSQSWRNPKNIMLSSSAREVWSKPNRVPGPGEYNVVPLEGSMLKPSHNVLLSDYY
jgi:hypothetical protein